MSGGQRAGQEEEEGTGLGGRRARWEEQAGQGCGGERRPVQARRDQRSPRSWALDLKGTTVPRMRAWSPGQGPRCLGRGGRAGSDWKALTSHAVSRPLWALASASVPRFLASVNGRSLTSLPPSFLELQLWEAEQEMGSKGSSSAALSSALLLTSPLGHAFAVSWAVPAQGRQLPPKPDVLCGLLDAALLP